MNAKADIFHTPSHTHETPAQSMQLRFINGSPVVDGNNVRAEIAANLSTASMQCELLRREQLGSPVVADCE